MLQFSYGATRFVVLFGPFAVKIARIRVLWVILRLCTHMKTGEVKERLGKFDRNPVRAGMKYILAGVISNLREDKLWSRARFGFLAPTFCTLFGLVNVQRRGGAVNQEEVDREHPFPGLVVGLSEEDAFDLVRAANFCRIEGRIHLCDYGKEEDFVLLMKFAERRAALAHAA